MMSPLEMLGRTILCLIAIAVIVYLAVSMDDYGKTTQNARKEVF